VAQTEAGRHLRPPEDAERRNDMSIFAYCTRNALRRKPTIVIIGESRDKATIQGTVELALTGHLVYSTMHVIGVAETLRRAIQPFPGDERQAMAIDIMQSMRMIVTQLLFPRKGGGRLACREYAIFDAGTRAHFLNRPVDDWPAIARRLMQEHKMVSKTMSDSAWDAFEAGAMSEETYKKIVSSQRDSA
jgi:defect-in-organelle-trafficking protein DotB